jgi:hypothetical protein
MPRSSVIPQSLAFLNYNQSRRKANRSTRTKGTSPTDTSTATGSAATTAARMNIALAHIHTYCRAHDIAPTHAMALAHAQAHTHGCIQGGGITIRTSTTTTIRDARPFPSVLKQRPSSVEK